MWLALIALAGAGVGTSLDGTWWAWGQLALLVLAAVMFGRRTAQRESRTPTP